MRAIAAESGFDLDEVMVRVTPMPLRLWSTGELAHPGFPRLRSDRVAGPAPSPLAIETEPEDLASLAYVGGVLDIVVGAPDRAWKRLRTDLRQSDALDLVVELERAGSLAVDLRSLPEEGSFWLCLDLAGEVAFAERVQADGLYEIDGLPPGDWTVTLERGAEHWRAERVGSAGVELVADQRAEAVLEVEPQAAIEEQTVPAVLRLEVPRARGVDAVDWEQTRIADQEPAWTTDGGLDLADDESGTWLVGRIERELPRGEYGLLLPDLGACLPLSIDGAGEYRVSVPAPVEFELEVVDAWSTGPITGARGYWYPAEATRLPAFFPSDLVPRDDGSSLSGKGADGAIEIVLGADGYVDRSATATLTHDGQQLRVELEPGARAEIRLLSDGAELAVSPSRESFRFEAVADGRDLGSGTVRGSRLLRTFDEPGRVRLFPPPIDGYTEPEPLEFDVLAGERTLVEVHYSRAW